MVDRVRTVLLHTRHTVIALAARPAHKPDPHQRADRDLLLLDVRAERDDPTDSLVPANMWEFDVGDEVARRARGRAGSGVEVFDRDLVS